MNIPLLKTTAVGIIFLIVLGCGPKKSDHEKMIEFGEKYTQAWNSGMPENMASFYAEDGTLTINEGTPSVGRDQLAETAQSFMEAFPDMVLTMDSLVADGDTYRYHWTFVGTYTGPGGTGNKVDFSGFERWTINEEGLVQKSIGTFDAEEYQRQLEGNNGDMALITETVENYFNGYMQSDEEMLLKAFDTENGAMKIISTKGESEAAENIPFSELVQRWSSREKFSQEVLDNSSLEILEIDEVDGKIASARISMKVDETVYIDILSLHKMNDQWKITNKIFMVAE